MAKKDYIEHQAQIFDDFKDIHLAGVELMNNYLSIIQNGDDENYYYNHMAELDDMADSLGKLVAIIWKEHFMVAHMERQLKK